MTTVEALTPHLLSVEALQAKVTLAAPEASRATVAERPAPPSEPKGAAKVTWPAPGVPTAVSATAVMRTTVPSVLIDTASAVRVSDSDGPRLVEPAHAAVSASADKRRWR